MSVENTCNTLNTLAVHVIYSVVSEVNFLLRARFLSQPPHRCRYAEIKICTVNVMVGNLLHVELGHHNILTAINQLI